jgi:hypothetical protein
MKETLKEDKMSLSEELDINILLTIVKYEFIKKEMSKELNNDTYVKNLIAPFHELLKRTINMAISSYKKDIDRLTEENEKLRNTIDTLASGDQI